MNDQDIKTKVRLLIKNNPIGILATIDSNGYPQQRPMYTAAVDDDFTICFATHRDHLKCKQIAENPKVSICWENVTEEMSTWNDAMIKGEAIVTDEKSVREKTWKADFLTYFPQGIDDPAFVVIVVKPTEMIYSDAMKYPPERIVF